LIRVAVVSVARSDYSILRPVLRILAADPDFDLQIIATGMHLSPEYGMTVDQFEADGFEVAHRVETLMSSDSPAGTSKSMGIGMVGLAEVYANHRPDVLVIMGDRFEMFAATAAALPFGIPVAHIHGGELSEGAIDDAMRHSITKMSHLHLVSTEDHRRRVIQLGEGPDRVIVCGAPALDNLHAFDALSKVDLERRFSIDLSRPPLLVTFHPTTLDMDRSEGDLDALLGALEQLDLPVVFTAPNADPAGRVIRRTIEHFCEHHSNARFVENFGTDGYYSLLPHVLAMVGNSSSGIIEAASFGLPVVNIGNRQKGRTVGANVVHAAANRDDILAAVKTAISSGFRTRIAGMANPYGDGKAATRIVDAIRAIAWSPEFCKKRFHDLVGQT
jgi:UDP-hydrolysing UDP-N-acetyl-D-glucosamine 2-epimerase